MNPPSVSVAEDGETLIFVRAPASTVVGSVACPHPGAEAVMFGFPATVSS